MSLWGEWQKCSLPQFFPAVFLSFKAGILRIWSLWSRKLLLEMTFFFLPLSCQNLKLFQFKTNQRRKRRLWLHPCPKRAKRKGAKGSLRDERPGEGNLKSPSVIQAVHSQVREGGLDVLQPVLGKRKPKCSERTLSMWCCNIPLKWVHVGAAAGITKQQCRDCGMLRNTWRKSWGRFWMDVPIAFVHGMGWWRMEKP